MCCYKDIGIPPDVTRAASVYCRLTAHHGTDLVQFPLLYKHNLHVFRSPACSGAVQVGRKLLQRRVDVRDRQVDASSATFTQTVAESRRSWSWWSIVLERGSTWSPHPPSLAWVASKRTVSVSERTWHVPSSLITTFWRQATTRPRKIS